MGEYWEFFHEPLLPGLAERASTGPALEGAERDVGRQAQRQSPRPAAAGLWPSSGLEPHQAHGRAPDRGTTGHAGEHKYKQATKKETLSLCLS